ncbi:MAG: Crp/Fnr family transcriptional regulator [Bacteroidia bacterium]|nr:Crp/Fnr family transcriptional regulator [Bacteroidia bacterium]
MSDNHNPNCQHCSVRFKSIFCKLSEDEVMVLNRKKVCGHYKKGDQIFMEGRSANSIFCINGGKVKITQIGEEGKEQILHLVGEGDVIGYRSVLSGEPYSVSATALEDSSICQIPKSMFQQMIESDNHLALEVIKILSDDLKFAERNITEFAQKPVKERIAEALLFIKETYGYESDGETLNVNLTREEIANIVGTATETTIRVLSDLKKHNILELKGRQIKIKDLNELVHIANIHDHMY